MSSMFPWLSLNRHAPCNPLYIQCEGTTFGGENDGEDHGENSGENITPT